MVLANLRKKQSNHHDILREAGPQGIDVICVTEACERTAEIKSESKGYKLAFNYGSKDQQYVCFYIRNGLAFKEQFHSPLTATLTIETDLGSVNIHNIYNHPDKKLDTNEIMDVATYGAGYHLTVGDFNLHHKDWDGHAWKHRPCTKAVELSDAMRGADYMLLNEPGVPTFETKKGAWVNDLMFASPELGILADWKPLDLATVRSDHRPVMATFKFPVTREIPCRRNWRKADVSRLTKLVKGNFEILGTLPTNPTIEEVEDYACRTAHILRESEELCVPRIKPHPNADPCMTPQVRELIKAKRRAQRAWRNNRSSRSLSQAFYDSSRELQRTLRNERRKWWRDKVGQTITKGKTPWFLVKTARFLRKPGQSVPMPDVVVDGVTYTDDEKKAEVLVDAIWSGKSRRSNDHQPTDPSYDTRIDEEILPDAYEDAGPDDDTVSDDSHPGFDEDSADDFDDDLEDDLPEDATLEEIVASVLNSPPRSDPPAEPTQSESQYHRTRVVTADEVEDILRRVHSGKAVGLDETSYECIKLCRKEVSPFLAQLFNACLRLGYYPKVFKESKTILLPKPSTPENKRDYSDADNWRPIDLLSCLGKILQSIVAVRMRNFVVDHNLVHVCQMGYVGKSTTTAIDYVVNIIRSAFTHRRVVSMLKLDVKSAYPSVQPSLLMDLLRKKQIPDWMIAFLDSWLADRSTHIRMPWKLSKPYPVNCGIPQGSPLSPLLFLLFASPLLDIIDGLQDTYGVAYADDTTILAVSGSAKANCRLLTTAHEKCDDWARSNGMAFNAKKYEVIHFDLRQSADARDDRLSCPTIPGMPRSALREKVNMLGVTLDQTLSWKPHVRQLAAKIKGHTATFSILNSSVHGFGMKMARLIYRAMIRPTVNYACGAWFVLEGPECISKKNMQILRVAQSVCLRKIAGAYKSTPRQYVEKELWVEDIIVHLHRMSCMYRAKQHGTPALEKIREVRAQIDLRGGYSRINDISNFRKLKYRPNPLVDLDERAGKFIEDEVKPRLEPDQRDDRSEILPMISTILKEKSEKEMSRQWEAFQLKYQSRSHQPVALREGWGKHALKRYVKLSRMKSSVLIQLRTEFIGTNNWLFKIKKAPSPDCLCGSLDSISHRFFQCRLLADARKELWDTVKHQSLRKLLDVNFSIAATWTIVNFNLDQYEWMKEHMPHYLK